MHKYALRNWGVLKMSRPRYKVVHRKAARVVLEPDVVENLKASEQLAGQLQPVLRDRYGNIIDGNHRLTVNPNWRTEKLEWVKNEKDRIIAKIHANYRRTVSKEELRKEFVRLADMLLRENRIDDLRNAPSAIAKLVPYSERYVRELLPLKYKHTEYSHVKEEQVPPTSRQEEEFISKSEQASTYRPPSGRLLVQGILPVEWFTLSGARCLVNWEQKKIWALPKT